MLCVSVVSVYACRSVSEDNQRCWSSASVLFEIKSLISLLNVVGCLAHELPEILPSATYLSLGAMAFPMYAAAQANSEAS